MKLSIVSTLYLSQDFLQELHQRLVAVGARFGGEFEIILVNDGSPDKSLAAALQIQQSDSRVKVVDLSRNFGHAKAILAGLSVSTGEYVMLIDSDLEEEPEWLMDFHATMMREDADVVYGVQKVRNHATWKNLTGAAFYRLFNRITTYATPEGWCTFRLMRRRYVDALLQMKDQAVYLGGLMIWVGFKQVRVEVQKSVRRPVSTYTPMRRLALAVEAVINFSTFPLQAAIIGGIFIAGITTLLAILLLLRKLIAPSSIEPGYASLLLSIWFLGGTIIMLIGIIGLYVARLTAEAKQRPQFVIRNVYQAELQAARSDQERLTAG